MPIYRAVASVVGGKYLGKSEAATPEEAKQIASESAEAFISLCHQCASECEDPEIQEVFVEEVEPEPEANPAPKKRRKR